VTDDNSTDTPPTDATASPRTSALKPVGAVVDDRIRGWQAGLRHSNPQRRARSLAVLARLRRGVGKQPGSVPDILAYTLAEEFVDTRATDDPTAQEVAAHIALTLYAMHQQSQSKPMHQRGHGLGRAIRQLNPEEPTVPATPVVRRFQALVTADTLDELVHHARGMVQLLRAAKPHGVPLDYGLLADQLVQWQRDGGPARVRMIWAREFYRVRNQDTSKDPSTPADTDIPADATDPS
jgi:CRISPR system Cascade subunit CasB